jgi:hypothetical protein
MGDHCRRAEARRYISESHVQGVRSYIRNQEEHHRKKTWEEEYNEYISKYGFERFPG